MAVITVHVCVTQFLRSNHILESALQIPRAG